MITLETSLFPDGEWFRGVIKIRGDAVPDTKERKRVALSL